MKAKTANMQQINVFDMLEIFNVGKESEARISSTDEEEFNPLDYLNKGVRIQTLLREKEERRKKNLVGNIVLEAINEELLLNKSASYEQHKYIRNRISAKVVKPFFKSLIDNILQGSTCSSNQLLIQDFFANFNEGLKRQVKLSLIKAGSYEEKLLKALFWRQKFKKIYGMYLFINGKRYLMPLNASVSKDRDGRKYTIRGKNEYICIIDGAKILSNLILCNEVYKGIMTELKKGNDSRLSGYLKRANEEMLGNIRNQEDGVIYIAPELDERYPNFKYMLAEKNLDYSIIKESKALELSNEYEIRPYLLKCGEIDYESQFYYVNTIFVEVFVIMVEEYAQDKRTNRYNRTTEHATVWQTKKNILPSVVKAMSESQFNNYFGYVEFDDDVDVEIMAEIENEFRALMTLFNQSKHEDTSIRFRKLGNHKAAGMYFPTIKCLCVDIRHPSSMAHEFFHLLDFKYGELSRKDGFYSVVKTYRKAFNDNVNTLSKDSTVKQSLDGGGKYNRNYYFEPTEIFARCGEVYLTKHLGVKNSLVKPDYGFAYPTNEELDKALKMYFDKFFEKYCKEK